MTSARERFSGPFQKTRKSRPLLQGFGLLRGDRRKKHIKFLIHPVHPDEFARNITRSDFFRKPDTYAPPKTPRLSGPGFRAGVAALPDQPPLAKVISSFIQTGFGL
jgi:hypothetical protein